MDLSPDVTLGNIVTWAIVVLGVIAAFLRTQWQGQKNERDIEELREQRERAAKEIYAKMERNVAEAENDLRREIGIVTTEVRREIEIVHKRQDKHNEQLTDALNALVIETRAMHRENTAFREKVASEYVTSARLADVMQDIHSDFVALGTRIDGIVGSAIKATIDRATRDS